MADNWYAGNAVTDGDQRRGWLLGHFIDAPGDPRSSTAVEIKWGVHPAGEERSAWHDTEQRTTAVLLVKGRFHVELSVGTVTLKREGDYVVWGPGISHSWRADEDSVVVTVRWPSIGG